MRSVYALIIFTVSIATITLYVRNPLLSPTNNLEYEYTQDRPPIITSTASKSSTANDSFAPTANQTRISKSSYQSVMPDNNASNNSHHQTKGLHLCTCLTPDSKNEADATIPKRLRWLHFPKTGTSFISTLWSYACSTRERYIDLEISSYQCDIFTGNKFSMYDFALMKRYPWEMYGSPNLLRKGTPLGNDTPFGLVGGTQHMALTPPQPDANPKRRQKMKGLLNKMKVWGSELDNNFTVAAFFRQPEERIVSAYYDGRHASGFTKNLYDAVKMATRRSDGCTIEGTKYSNPLECFANFPGIAGCMARMLTGEMCADGVLQDSGLENVPEAVDIIMNRLKFVGITEDWNESVCQFHRLFSGKLDEDGKRYWSPPLQGEFANVHTSTKLKQWDVKDLHGFKDTADGVIYQAAKLKFQQITDDNKCYKYMSWDELEGENGGPDKLTKRLPYLRTDPNGNLCQPKTCTDLQKQCGEWDDGCGATVICGLCNGGRTGLPETWRVQCIEGQCVDYCPTWHTKGLWFKSDMQKHGDSKLFSQIVSEMRDETFLSPLLAVKICVAVCTGSGIKKDFDESLCKCGDTPTKFLSSSLNATYYSTAHDLKANCVGAKANLFKFTENQTQPECCQKVPELAPSKSWKKLSVMSKLATRDDNIEGEYFDHVLIGCGAYEECEAIGRKRKAELVVFDRYNSFCHLAKNVFRLEDSYTLTKDNTQRYYLDLRQ